MDEGNVGGPGKARFTCMMTVKMTLFFVYQLNIRSLLSENKKYLKIIRRVSLGQMEFNDR